MLARLPSPAQKGSAKELRIGFVTDTHIMSTDVNGRRIIGQKYQDRLNFFIERMNNVFGADILIANGDIIEGTRQTSDTGRQELTAVKNIFNRTSIPTYWALGNHDLRAVTKKQWKNILGIDYEYKAFDVKQYRIFILDSNFNNENEDVRPGPGRSYTRGKVSSEQLVWLEKELQKTKKKPLVFMHHPPLRNIDSKIDGGLLKNANELRRIFAENNVFAVFAGHIEDLYFEKTDGVRYFVLPGLVKNPDFQGTFAEISASSDDIEVDVNYLKKDGSYRTIQMKQK
jgi:3',5'-cyclic AMP phosphodiesterase CpdA